MQTIVVVLHVFAAVAIIGLVLMQHGKGADAGAAFGSGASSTVFGSRGSSSFLTRATAGLAAVFFVTSLGLAYFAGQREEPVSVTETVAPAATEEAALPQSELPPVPAETDVPAVPAPEGTGQTNE